MTKKGMEARTYAVFLPDNKWGRTNSLKEARAAVDKHGGEIYSYSWTGGKGSWDAPTIKALWDKVPYTPKYKKEKTNGIRITPKTPRLK